MFLFNSKKKRVIFSVSIKFEDSDCSGYDDWLRQDGSYHRICEFPTETELSISVLDSLEWENKIYDYSAFDVAGKISLPIKIDHVRCPLDSPQAFVDESNFDYKPYDYRGSSSDDRHYNLETVALEDYDKLEMPVYVYLQGISFKLCSISYNAEFEFMHVGPYHKIRVSDILNEDGTFKGIEDG